MADTPLLRLERLRYRRDEFTLDATLSLREGERGIIIGPSGSGKSTLLRLVAGFERALDGRILLAGRELAEVPPEGRGVGMVFQGDALFPALRVRDNVAYGPRRRGLSRGAARAETEDLARRLGFGALLGRWPRELSGGERQRVALARALAGRPRLLLLDEALSSLDEGARTELGPILDELAGERGITRLEVTHDRDHALSAADRLFLMEAGRFVAEGRPRELYERPPCLAAARGLGAGPLIAADSPAGRELARARAALGQPEGVGTTWYFFPAHRARVTGDAPGSGARPATATLRATAGRLRYLGGRELLTLTLQGGGELELPISGEAPRGELWCEVDAEAVRGFEEG